MKTKSTVNKTKSDSVSTNRFSWLIKQRGYQYWDEDHLEEVVQVQGSRPDFYVKTIRNGDLFVEIESFEKESFSAQALRQNPVMCGLAEHDWDRIRDAAKRAAKQLKPYSTLNIPMLVVLDNWRQVGLPCNVVHLRCALLGAPELRLSLNEDGGVPGEAKLHHGAGQFFNSREKNYISAVAWNLSAYRPDDVDPMTEERPMYLRIAHNPWATLPLPREIFSEPKDEHWGYDDQGNWVEFQTNARN